jgi:hypothetical protein
MEWIFAIGVKRSQGFRLTKIGVWKLLIRKGFGAGDRIRTRDVQLGKTLQHRFLNTTEFPERQEAQKLRFQGARPTPLRCVGLSRLKPK